MIERKKSIAILFFGLLFFVAINKYFFVNASQVSTMMQSQSLVPVDLVLPPYKLISVNGLVSKVSSNSTNYSRNLLKYADFDNDGILDLVDFSNGHLILHRGLRDEKFGATENLFTQIEPTALAVGDIYGNGCNELIILDSRNSLIQVWGQQKTKSTEVITSPLKLIEEHSVISDSSMIITTELDGDEITDVVCISSNGILFLSGSKNGLVDGVFSAFSTKLKAADVISNNGNQIFIADKSNKQILVWQWKNGKLQLEQVLNSDIFVNTLTTGDINDDGLIDVVAASEDGFFTVFTGSRDSSLFMSTLLSSSIVGSNHIELAQMNGDGYLDIVVNDSSGRLFVLPGTKDRKFGEPSIILGTENCNTWTTARLNIDALSDLISFNNNNLNLILTQPLVEIPLVTTLADSEAGSLRAALQAAIDNEGGEIKFKIPAPTPAPAGGIFTIKLASPLPVLSSGKIVINGDSQKANISDSNPKGPEIFIDATDINVGLSITSAGNVIRGIGITKSTGAGIQITGSNARNNKIEGCYIGTNADGTIAQGNNIGIIVEGGAGINTVGGAGISRNIISGNTDEGIILQGAGTSNNTIHNNVIGLKQALDAVLGNKSGIVIQSGASNNIIGRTASADGNIISGNSDANIGGILIDGAATTANTIQGNFIGTNTAGILKLANAGSGVRIINGSSLNVIGGEGAARNIIAFNGKDGVIVGASKDDNAIRNRISRNLIYGNTGIGIDLADDAATENDLNDADTGPNALQNKPTISQVVLSATNLVITGKLDTSNPNTNTVEVFANFAGSGTTPGSQQFLSSTSPDSSGNFTVTVTAPTGIFTVSSTATDADGNTSEFSPSVSTTSLPDLIIEKLVVTPTSIGASGVVSITFDVKNQGTQGTTVASNCSIVLSNDNVIDGTDVLLMTIQTPATLAAGASASLKAEKVTIPAGVEVGAKFIGVIADSGNTIKEASETNNTASTALAIQAPKADVSIGAFTLSSVAIPPSGSIIANLTITNLGGGSAASSDTEIRLSADPTITRTDTLLTTINTGVIGAGTSLPIATTLNFPSNITPGKYFVGVIVDATSLIDESNETNNTASISFTVSGLPDLFVSDLTINPLKVEPGSSVTVDFTIRNKGGTAAIPTTHDVLLSNDNVLKNGEDILLVTRPTGTLSPDGETKISVNISIPITATPGNKFLGVIADAGGLVAEVAEDNNVKSTQVIIIDQVKPLISIIHPNGNEKIPAGKIFTCEWKVSDNVGVVSQDLYVSTDGGITFPFTIATGLKGDVTTYAWNVSPNLSTSTARFRVIAKDPSDNTGMADSSSNFLIAIPPTISQPKFLDRKLIFLANSTVQVGAKLVVTAGTFVETFDLITDTKNVRVKADTKSTPSKKLISKLIPKGAQATLMIINPDGMTSDKLSFTR